VTKVVMGGLLVCGSSEQDRAPGPLAHLTSGSYAGDAAWVGFAVLAFDLARAASLAAGMGKVRWATLRRRVITVPARLATTARRLVLHLPTAWPWADAWTALWDTITTTGPPPAALCCRVGLRPTGTAAILRGHGHPSDCKRPCVGTG
jgi:hypothetical protein